jgi:branched-chain amino acid aminotransferase
LKVQTFEWTGSLSPIGFAPDLGTASTSLPQGSYTTLRTYGGTRVVRLLQHVDRLRDSAAIQGQEAGRLLEERVVRAALGGALRACGHPESRARLTWAPLRLFVSVEPFEPLPESLYREGAACVTRPGRRDAPRAKDTHFIAAAAEAYRRLPPGVHEELLVSGDGAILEGLSSNFFAVVGGVLRTEGERALPGVTRSMVLEVARSLLPVSETALTLDALPQVSEAFITSASRGVLPVTRIDGRPVGDGRPGPVTREVMDRFAAHVEREAETI